MVTTVALLCLGPLNQAEMGEVNISFSKLECYYSVRYSIFRQIRAETLYVLLPIIKLIHTVDFADTFPCSSEPSSSQSALAFSQLQI